MDWFKKGSLRESSPLRQRMDQYTDKGSFREFDRNVVAWDPLHFPGYSEKLQLCRLYSGVLESVLCGYATIGLQPCVVVMFVPEFMLGTMGTAAGEKITRAFERAARRRLPVITVTASGGARMQEGVLSLMQMIKTSGAVDRHSRLGLLYLSVISNPTYGGVTASFASLGDVIIVEADAYFGFTGKKIIKNTLKVSLPDQFQSAAFAMEHGMADIVIQKAHIRNLLFQLLSLHEKRGKKYGFR